LTGIVENGALIRAWGTSQDITGRKQAELALRESEERMRRITDATQDALWEIDLKTKHLWWSEGAIPLFGHSPAVLEIGLEDWYNGINPEDVDQVKPKFETFLQSGDLDWTDEYRFRRADGSYATSGTVAGNIATRAELQRVLPARWLTSPSANGLKRR